MKIAQEITAEDVKNHVQSIFACDKFENDPKYVYTSIDAELILLHHLSRAFSLVDRGTDA